MKKEIVNFKLYEYEKIFWNKNLSICGIDEVGRGCLAGPVVTTAAILHKNSYHPELTDSKILSKSKLLVLYDWLMNNCIFSIGINSSRTIDTYNIYKTTQKTMLQSLRNLHTSTHITPSLILIDAMPLDLSVTPYAQVPSKSLIKGELKSASIAAASIIAKVTRDRILQRIHKAFPCYNLSKHKGYGTKEHKATLLDKHASVVHRNTFLTKILPKKEPHEQQTIF